MANLLASIRARFEADGTANGLVTGGIRFGWRKTSKTRPYVDYFQVGVPVQRSSGPIDFKDYRFEFQVVGDDETSVVRTLTELERLFDKKIWGIGDGTMVVSKGLNLGTITPEIDAVRGISEYSIEIETLDPTLMSGATLTAWLQGDRIYGLLDGAKIASIPDLVTANGNWVQGTDANRPLYQTNEANGYSVIESALSGKTVENTSIAVPTDPTTWVCIYRMYSVPTASSDIAIIQNGAGGLTRYLGVDLTGGDYVASDGTNKLVIGDGTRTGQYFIHTVEFDGASSKVYEGKTQQATGLLNTSASVGLLLGGITPATPSAARIVGFFQFDGLLGQFQRDKLITVLGSKHGITV